ncbi:MAG: rod shape-determining protein MreD [Woeseiaceae bacterium]|nr:rod shape-determining protein MreD [Woeseiaceae bacterium]
MSSHSAARHVPVIVTFVVALALMMLPLPRAVDTFRPDWVLLVAVFWSLRVPRSYGVGVAFLLGVVLDVAQGTLLGQHALALCVVAFLVVKFHLQIRVFPLLQVTATVFALNALYQFLLFWINGVAGIAAPASTYWGPVVTGAIFWPPLFLFLNGIRYQAYARG